MEQHLTAVQREVLKSFILDFLPDNESLIKNSKVELIYITKVLNRLFNKWFDFNISVANVFEIFEEEGYALSVVEPLKADCKESPYIKTNSSSIYISISSLIVNELEEIIAHHLKDLNPKTKEGQDLLVRLSSFMALKKK